MPIPEAQMKAKALELLDKRKRAAAEWRQKHSEGHAGDLMWFFCKICGWPSDIKQEEYFVTTPRQHCSECEGMLERGWIKTN